MLGPRPTQLVQVHTMVEHNMAYTSQLNSDSFTNHVVNNQNDKLVDFASARQVDVVLLFPTNLLFFFFFVYFMFGGCD